MATEPPEDGFEELARLSQQFKKQEQERSEREQQRNEQRKKVHDVLGGLKELNISMAIEQLKLVATPEIIEQVNALKSQAGTEALRKIISDLAYEMESQLSNMAVSNPDIRPLENRMKTLTVLTELFFSLH